MSQKFAMIFPGQGSQSVGMLSELADSFSEVKLIFEQASTILKYDLWELVQSGSAEKLDQTVFTQPALLAADIAVWTCFQKLTDLKPDRRGGHRCFPATSASFSAPSFPASPITNLFFPNSFGVMSFISYPKGTNLTLGSFSSSFLTKSDSSM